MNIYWEIDYRRLATGTRDDTVIGRIAMPARDLVPVNIRIVDRDYVYEEYTVSELADDETIRFGAKSAFDDATYLFDETTWTLDDTDSDDPFYEGELDLNTNELVSAIGTTPTLTVWGELAVVKDSRNYHTTRFLIDVANDVVRTESTPSTEVTDKFRIIDGVPYVYNADQDKYLPLRSTGDANAATLELGQQGLNA